MTAAGDRQISNIWLIPIAIVIISAIWWSGAPDGEEDSGPAVPPPASPVIPPSPKPVAPGTAANPRPLSSRARSLQIALDRKASIADRIDALEALGRQLTREEQAALYKLAKTRGENNTIRNNAFDMVAASNHPPAGLGRDLLCMWRSPDEDRIWKDYCLQKVPMVYEIADNRDELLAELFRVSKAKREKGMVYPGTALLSLNRIKAKHPEIKQKVDFLARHLIMDKGNDPEVMVSAFNVARSAGDDTLLARARDIVRDKKQLARLRMAGMAYLAQVSRDLADKKLIAGFTRDKERRIARAAQLNLKKIEDRLKADN